MKDDASATALLQWISNVMKREPVSREHVQSLWSGYGEISRIRFDDGSSVIVKCVEPPANEEHPRGWSGARSHERKLRSYDVEYAFYSDFAAQCGPPCSVPACIALDKTVDQAARGWRFLLEDLDAAGFDGRRHKLTTKELNACLKWLAHFHARFLGEPPEELWPVGTYWHLATRPDELAAMPDGQLREAARALDSKLNACRFKTYVHGDAKLANFCFGRESVAAVDFQYVGGGCGMKDVAYFMSSCLSDDQCESEGAAHLNTYFAFLRGALAQSAFDGAAVEAEWRALYPVAWADFHRFLAGWAPSHWKIHRYTRSMTQLALDLV